jgi:septal ring factor EnvC (AmiA/AmiB activator)
LEKKNDSTIDVKSQLAAAQTTINQQKSQLDTLTKENADLKKQLDTANATIADLQKKLETCGNTDITINFNIFGQILWALIQLFGNNKKG